MNKDNENKNKLPGELSGAEPAAEGVAGAENAVGSASPADAGARE